MKILKSFLAVILVSCMLFCLVACNDNGSPSNSDDTASDSKNTDQTTESANDTEEEPADPVFTVTVVDEDGAPVPGVTVQICLDACVIAPTNDEGVATFNNIEVTSSHKLSVPVCPEGYEYKGESEVYLEDGMTEYTVVVSKVA